MTTVRIRQLSVRLSLLLVAVATSFLLIGGAADAGTHPEPSTEYVVQQGDTLWAIAARHTDEGTDVRSVVEAIKRTSGIQRSDLRPGQVLLIPGA